MSTAAGRGVLLVAGGALAALPEADGGWAAAGSSARLMMAAASRWRVKRDIEAPGARKAQRMQASLRAVNPAWPQRPPGAMAHAECAPCLGPPKEADARPRARSACQVAP